MCMECRRLLFFLIPLMMRIGRLPTADVLTEYGFEFVGDSFSCHVQYASLCECYRTGNVVLFDTILLRNQQTLTKRGLEVAACGECDVAALLANQAGRVSTSDSANPGHLQ